MCASADQLLFGSRSGGPGSASQSALGVRGDLAPGAVCGPTRTLFQPEQKVLNLEHYLEALTKKPGALAGSTPLEQWRAQGHWPASFDRFWEALKQRRGQQDGTRAMIEALLLGRQDGYPALNEALEKALGW